MKKQKLLLVSLVAVLVLAIAYAFWATPRQDRITAPERPATAARPGLEPKAPGPGGDFDLRLDLLEREAAAFNESDRDIFSTWEAAPPPPPPPPKRLPPPPPPPVATTEPTVVPSPVQRALARFTFLGFLEKDGQKTVFLSSQDELFVVKKGDRFGGNQEFFVTEVTPDRLTIQQKDVAGVITVSLAEEEALRPSFKGTGPPSAVSGRVQPRRFTPPPRPAFTEAGAPMEPLTPPEVQPGVPSAAGLEQQPGAVEAGRETSGTEPPDESSSSSILQPLPASPVVRPYGE